MDIPEFSLRNHRQKRRVVDANPVPIDKMPRRGNRQRLQCHDVARNRAQRYARRHRIARPLRPLIAATILVALLLERRPDPLFARPGRKREPDQDSGSAGAPAVSGETHYADAAFPAGGGTVGAARGAPEPRLRPPSGFLAKDLAQIVAFLIRNRGRVDNEVVRMKWAMLDRMSLPLAVYLRDVEANGAWNELDDEIPRSQLPAQKNPERKVRPSLHHRRILGLLPEWSSRGETLLALLVREPDERQPVPEGDDDDRDPELPAPGRPTSSRRD